jgi:hypothetical protein
MKTPLVRIYLGFIAAGFLSTYLASSADDTIGGTSSNPPKPAIGDWRSVESPDYQTYVKNLQAAGFPPETIQSIVTSDVISAFAGKRAEATAARYQNWRYWQSNPDMTKASAVFAAQRRTIDEEMDGVLQQLLGVDTDLPDVNRQWQQEEWNNELTFLTSDKIKATELIFREYAKVNLQIKELAAGLNLTEDTNELQQILARYQDEQADLKQALSPAEIQQVEMATSWTAENLRQAMVKFDPTEEEFSIVFEAWHPYDENLARIHALRESDPGNLSNAVYAQIKTGLSPDRYQQYCDTWWK